jgi:hypothetical protein
VRAQIENSAALTLRVQKFKHQKFKHAYSNKKKHPKMKYSNMANIHDIQTKQFKQETAFAASTSRTSTRCCAAARAAVCGGPCPQPTIGATRPPRLGPLEVGFFGPEIFRTRENISGENIFGEEYFGQFFRQTSRVFRFPCCAAANTCPAACGELFLVVVGVLFTRVGGSPEFLPQLGKPAGFENPSGP